MPPNPQINTKEDSIIEPTAYRLHSLLGLVVVGSEAIPLGRQAGTKLLWDEGERGGVLLPSNLNQKLLLGRNSSEEYDYSYV